VDELLQELEIDTNDLELDDTAPEAGSEEGSIEDNVEEMLAMNSSADMQETGAVASKLPPPEEGEDIMAYYRRIQGMGNMQGAARRKMMGGRPSMPDEEAEVVE
jgi:hypothetical protein